MAKLVRAVFRCDQERKLPRDDADLCGVVELGEELLAVVSSQAESAYVGDADPRYHVTNGQKSGGIEFAVHHCRFCPGYKTIQGQLMSQVRGKFFSNS
ncbi:hypothetical protein ACYX34_07885 [Nitrospira sp. CMX1]|nr:hypothetical protein [Nitrospira sp.]MBS0167288.1 hypothetical protein [Nitrospira sp.]